MYHLPQLWVPPIPYPMLPKERGHVFARGRGIPSAGTYISSDWDHPKDKVCLPFQTKAPPGQEPPLPLRWNSLIGKPMGHCQWDAPWGQGCLPPAGGQLPQARVGFFCQPQPAPGQPASAG